MLNLYQLLPSCALACGALLLTLALSYQPSNAQQTSTISLEPCEVAGAEPGAKEKALCGSYDVFEDRAAKSGRKIALKILVFPATGNHKSNDPLFYIPGGPGSSATEDAPYVAQELNAIRERRDLVFVDQRGTGGSNPLNCEFFNQSDLRSYFGYYFPLDAVRKCRAQLEPKADLRLYTTTIAMDDLDDVRRALGYEKINLHGGSYGTRAVQVYLKNHQSHVRTIVLHGVSPTNQFMPRDFPEHTERALNGVLDECNADDACRNAFPKLRDDAKKVLARLLIGPVAVDLKLPPANEAVHLELSRDLAGEAVRYMLYQPGAASRIPLFLHLAAQGNFVPLAESALYYRQEIVATGSNGMYLSVTCAEDLPMIKSGEGERKGKDTFLGDYRLRQQRAACALWPRGDIPKNYAEPTRSNVPALILTGQWDPVTPPAYGDSAAKSLPNSLHVVVPHGGHGFGGLNGIECVDKLIAAFVNSGNAKGLDTACVGSIRRKGFALKLQEANQ
ncbi:MAG TPA: alpha/beta fold hydrolase [Pyrinomonadaceae bacterium]|jgi:pimeloyl-ACP methyl ester carboxylesterase|nr:alpha/beta fold hydrolase [Pyrinomonadaceae bacterium]